MLATKRLQMKLLGPADAPEVTRYLARNREHFSGAGPRVDDDYFSVEYQRRRLTSELELMEAGSFFRVWLYLATNGDVGAPIGDISLSHIMRGIMHSCFLGYKID